MRTIIFLLSFLIISCQEKKVSSSTFISPDCDSLKRREIATLKQYTKSIFITQYSYSDTLWNQMYNWLDNLPANIKEDILDRKILVNKKYFLSDIILQNEYKIDSIKQLNTQLEQSISNQIGLRQGLPTVIFSTSINSSEESDRGKDELIILEVNQLLY